MTTTKFLPLAAVVLLVGACGQRNAEPVATEEAAGAMPAEAAVPVEQPALPRSRAPPRPRGFDSTAKRAAAAVISPRRWRQFLSR